MSAVSLHSRLLDEFSDPVCSFDPSCRYLYANHAFADGIGKNLDEIVGLTIWDVFPKDEADKRSTIIKWVFDHGEAKTHEMSVRGRNGDRYYFTTVKPIFGDQGRVSAVLANSKDITERRKAEEALTEQQEIYRAVAEHGQALIWMSGLDKGCYYFNAPWLAFTGRTLEQEQGNGWAEGVHPDDLQRCLEIYGAAYDRREAFAMEYRLRRHDGEHRWILDEGTPRYDGCENFVGFVGHCLDITERKRVEMKLRSSEERLQLALSGDEFGFWDWHISSGEVLCSEHCFSMLGLPSFIGKLDLDSWIKFSHPDDLASVNAALDSHLKGQAPTYECEHRMLHQDGRWLWLHDRGRVVEWDKIGAPCRAVGTYSDITARKQAEKELARSQRRYQGILHNMMDAYWRIDEKGRIVEVNEAICQMHGYSKEELLRMSISDFEAIESAEDTRKHIQTIIREGRDIFESRHRCRDGRFIDVEISASMASDAPGNIDAFHRDITERKKMEYHIRELAFHDPLTKLPNRRLLIDRLAQAMAASKRSGNYAALMMLDLDNFKPLNDEHGHDAGDLLLVEVARQLTECVRETDTVARVGGDEFVVILGELNADSKESARQAAEIAEKIRVSLAARHRLILNEGSLAGSAVEHRCSASIGVVLFLNHEASQSDLLKWADLAMYQAKGSGRNAIRFYGVTQLAPPEATVGSTVATSDWVAGKLPVKPGLP
jgi:diguanylate cyclase (GGDEF)-like protein/PAS domain S-box-containing protein